jgi:fibronectin-binding autotransporter adhesin
VRVTDITETLPGMKVLKTGTGTVELEGTGAYTGDTEVLGGILLIENAAAFGSGSLVLGATSGATTATARFSTGLTITNPIVARAGSTGDVTLDADAGNVLWSGGVTLQRSLRLDNGSTVAPATVGGLISGTGNLVKVSNGEIVLANPANHFTGTVEITAGSIAVATDGALGNASNGISLSGNSAKLDITTSFATARTITLGGSSAGINVAADQTLVLNAPFAGAGPLVLDDTGIVEINPTVDNSARASAATTISKGTLRISNPTAIGDGTGLVTLNGSTATLALLSDTGFAMAHPVTIGNSGGTVHVDRALAGSGIGGTHSIGDVSAASGALNLTGANGYSLQAGSYTASTTHTLQQNAPGGLVLASLTGANVTTNRTLTITGDGPTTITGAITEVAGTGRWEMVKTGTGTFRFGNGISGFDRALTVREGAVDLNGLTYAPESLVLGVNTSANTATVRTSGGTLALAGTVSYTIGGLGFAAPPPSVIEGNIDLGAVEREFAISNSSGTTVELTTDGPITGAAGLLKSGSGVMRLAGSTSNTFGGPLTMTSGTLELAKSSGNSIPAAGINSTGGTTRWLASNQVDDTATLAASSSSAVTFDLNDQSDAVGGVSLTQTNGSQASVLRTGGTGTLTLLGTLTLANNTDSASTNVRNVLVTGTGTRTSTGASGTLDLGGGTRTIHVTTTTVGGNAVNAGATIETAIVNGGIIKSGPQPLVLGHPANTFSGGLQINEGIVRAGQAGSLGAGPVVFSQSGAVDAALVVSGTTGEFTGDVTIGGGGTGASILRCDALPPQVVTFSGNLDLEKDLTVDVVYGSTRGSSSTTLDLTGQIGDGLSRPVW